MSKKPSSGTSVQDTGNGAGSSPHVAGLDGTSRDQLNDIVDLRGGDRAKFPLGLRLVGTVVNRSAREFEGFVKVFYEVQCGSERHIMVEMLPKPFDPGKCLAIGMTGAWEVWIHTYLDKRGRTQIQITRKTAGLPGTKPF